MKEFDKWLGKIDAMVVYNLVGIVVLNIISIDRTYSLPLSRLFRVHTTEMQGRIL